VRVERVDHLRSVRLERRATLHTVDELARAKAVRIIGGDGLPSARAQSLRALDLHQRFDMAFGPWLLHTLPVLEKLNDDGAAIDSHGYAFLAEPVVVNLVADLRALRDHIAVVVLVVPD
jgi:hypothetical protein